MKNPPSSLPDEVLSEMIVDSSATISETNFSTISDRCRRRWFACLANTPGNCCNGNQPGEQFGKTVHRPTGSEWLKLTSTPDAGNWREYARGSPKSYSWRPRGFPRPALEKERIAGTEAGGASSTSPKQSTESTPFDMGSATVPAAPFGVPPNGSETELTSGFNLLPR